MVVQRTAEPRCPSLHLFYLVVLGGETNKQKRHAFAEHFTLKVVLHKQVMRLFLWPFDAIIAFAPL